MKLLVYGVILLFGAAVAEAQTGSWELRGAAGWTGFLDEGSQNHLLVAPSVRYYFRRQMAVEGELQYLRQNRGHYDVILLPSFVWDVRRGRVVPYLSVGLGVMHSSFPRFGTTEVFLQGGAGVKFFLDDHFYVAPELKIGVEPHTRISGVIGYRW